jgi:exodeoxyribonuclease VII small subunit
MRTTVTGTTDERSADDTPLSPPDELSFDDALAELQRTIAELESGNLPVVRTLALHERGAALLDRCETLLRSAELRMRQLVAKGSTLDTVDVTEDRTVDES